MHHRSAALVGREQELRLIMAALAATSSGVGTAIFLTGDAGIGKSRLASVAAGRADAAGLGLMRGRASSIGPSAPFRPLTEAILYLLRTEPVDPAELGPYGPILGRVVPGWGAPPSGYVGESDVVLAEALLQLTGLVGRDRGCLLVLDDLHDADAETLTVLEYLVDNIDQQPAVLLGCIRDQHSTAHALAMSAAQRGRCAMVELDRFDRDELERLAESCLCAGSGTISGQALDLLWAGSAGNPFMAEEMLQVMIADRVLVRGHGVWELAANDDAAIHGLARPLARQVANLGPQTRQVLSAAATFGSRFPLSVLREATKLRDQVLLSLLQDDLAGHLIAPDETTPEWYVFHHQLSRDAVLAQLDREEQVRLATTVADALDVLHPDHPGEWCRIAAQLRLEAGDRPAAGRLFAEAGRRALAAGAATSAVSFLDRALGLLADKPAARAFVLEDLLFALAEAGEVERALFSVGALRLSGLTAQRRANLHTKVAWAALVAGRIPEAEQQIEAARRLLGPAPAPEDIASIDAVAAHLALDQTGEDQFGKAERLARQAATVAESVPLPVVACQAWQLLGAIVRHRNPDEATACLERANSLAIQHGLPIWEIHALIRLGNDDALRHADTTRLERARDHAARVGAVTAGYQAESSIALHTILRGDHAAAGILIDQVLARTTRLRLLETTRYLLLLRAVLAGHSGDRGRMTAALEEFQQWGGNLTLHGPRVHGLAGAFCALMEEDRPLAHDELDRAMSSMASGSSVYYLSGRHGLNLLLRVLSGAGGWWDYQVTTIDPASVLRWDKQFTLFAHAVLLGRAGDADKAAAVVAEALTVSEPYAMSRHLGLRLISEAAINDGWGQPASWLRSAEDYFRRREIPAVAGACRALLRKAGLRVPQNRSGTERIPVCLRSIGVTVREYEVLGLLVGRLGNQEIAHRLHLSPRTVERHVGSLMAKTGLTNRIALGTFAAELVNDARTD